MFSLQKLLGKEDKFFTLLEASAQEARTSVQALVKLSKDLERPTATEDFAYSRRKDKQITQEISAAVYTTFITALEREDIEDLSNALYKIPKTVEKFTERALLAPNYVRGIDFSKQMGLLERATEIVVELVKCLRDGMNLEKIKELNDKLQFLEGEADKHMVVLYRDLFCGKHEPVQVIVLKDLYELLEKMIDRCRDAGNVIAHVALKNS
ncbi:MAG TPA: pit accessory protein [Verrucomicrobiae bacterium]